MTQNGQVTIPTAIRERLGLIAKDRVRPEVEGDEVEAQIDHIIAEGRAKDAAERQLIPTRVDP